MVHAAALIEERLSEQSLITLKHLVGSNLHIRMPWIFAYADGTLCCDQVIFLISINDSNAQCAALAIEELEAPVTQDHYYRYSVNLRNDDWIALSSEFCSSWNYDSGTDKSHITAIEIYSYSSLPDQVKVWPETVDFPEARNFDYELIMVMSDGGRVSIKPMHNNNLLYLTLTPSFELPHYQRTLGENLNLRLTIN